MINLRTPLIALVVLVAGSVLAASAGAATQPSTPISPAYAKAFATRAVLDDYTTFGGKKRVAAVGACTRTGSKTRCMVSAAIGPKADQLREVDRVTLRFGSKDGKLTAVFVSIHHVPSHCTSDISSIDCVPSTDQSIYLWSATDGGFVRHDAEA